MLRHLALVIAVALAATGCKTKIDGAKANGLVEKMMAEHGIAVTAACPSGLPAKKGSRFQCAAQMKGTGQKLTIDVEMTDDKGTVNAQLVGTIVDTAKYVEAVRKQLGVEGATLKCASTVVVVTQAEPAACEITDGTITRKFEIFELDPAKHTVNWRMADEHGTFPAKDGPPGPGGPAEPAAPPATP